MPHTPDDARGKVTLPELGAMRARSQSIVMITAYDAPSARLADEAGVDVILVGDSAGTTVLGGASTVPVTMDEMVVFTRAASRGTRHALLVADMPFGSYQVTADAAVANAVRLVKDGGAEAVKLEGAGAMVPHVRAIVDAGIPVMGHVGLKPQSAALQGGYRAQARTAAEARTLIEDARALERAGCFAIVLEAIPSVVARHVTGAIGVPTIGIGAGPDCSGQVLVWHDLLGLTGTHVGRFVRRYADLQSVIGGALQAYVADVRSHAFPNEHESYGMPDVERTALDADLAAKK